MPPSTTNNTTNNPRARSAPAPRSTTGKPTGKPIGRSPSGQMLKNGELGASAHTISEPAKIKFTRLILALREDASLTEIEMPADLTNTERKFIHELAKNFGLTSKSHGKGEGRRIKITKKADVKVQAGGGGNGGEGDGGDGDVPTLSVSPAAKQSLAAYLRRLPPTAEMKKESLETGSSIGGTSGMEDGEVERLLRRILPRVSF